MPRCVMPECEARAEWKQPMCAAHLKRVPHYLQQIIRKGYRRRGADYYRAVEEAKQIVLSMAKTVQPVTWRELMTRRSA